MSAVTIAIRELTNNINWFFRKFFRRLIRKIAEIILRDLDLMGSLEGVRSSVEFEKTHLRRVPEYKNRRALFETCLKHLEVDGMMLEMGVYKGDSINLLAKLRPDKRFIGFDSFEGLPEDWTLGSRKGSFSISGRLPVVRKNVTLVKGFFEETLAPFSELHQSEKIAFMHIDCDLYSATKTVLKTLGSMITSGTIIVFDEYFNYPGWEEGEFKAFAEYVEESRIKFEYIVYIRTGSQVAIKIK